MGKTIDQLVAELMQLSGQGYGDAVVYVDTDTTMGFAAISEVHVESTDRVTLR